jgi:hypothetical protein
MRSKTEAAQAELERGTLLVKMRFRLGRPPAEISSEAGGTA